MKAEQRPEHVAIKKIGVFEEDQWNEQRDDGHDQALFAHALLVRALNPAHAEIRNRRQQEGHPDIADLPPGVEHCAAGDDQDNARRARDDQVENEINGKELEEDRARRARDDQVENEIDGKELEEDRRTKKHRSHLPARRCPGKGGPIDAAVPHVVAPRLRCQDCGANDRYSIMEETGSRFWRMIARRKRQLGHTRRHSSGKSMKHGQSPDQLAITAQEAGRKPHHAEMPCA